MAKKTPNFEKALNDLETLVEEMEQGNLSLEESLKRFEKGIALSSECQQALQNAELKITQLIEKNGKLMEQDAGDQTTGEPAEPELSEESDD